MPIVDEDFILTHMKADPAFLGHPQFHRLLDMADWEPEEANPHVARWTYRHNCDGVTAGARVKVKLIAKVDPVDYCLFPDSGWRSGPEHDMAHYPANAFLTEPWEFVYVDS